MVTENVTENSGWKPTVIECGVDDAERRGLCGVEKRLAEVVPLCETRHTRMQVIRGQGP